MDRGVYEKMTVEGLKRQTPKNTERIAASIRNFGQQAGSAYEWNRVMLPSGRSEAPLKAVATGPAGNVEGLCFRTGSEDSVFVPVNAFTVAGGTFEVPASNGEMWTVRDGRVVPVTLTDTPVARTTREATPRATNRTTPIARPARETSAQILARVQTHGPIARPALAVPAPTIATVHVARVYERVHTARIYAHPALPAIVRVDVHPMLASDVLAPVEPAALTGTIEIEPEPSDEEVRDQAREIVLTDAQMNLLCMMVRDGYTPEARDMVRLNQLKKRGLIEKGSNRNFVVSPLGRAKAALILDDETVVEV